ncbi:MAG TPA: amidase [Burkholderiaceae bacterium]|nr:amidase [Burkholderiaceae bacterium]
MPPADPALAFVPYPPAPVPNSPDGPLAGLDFAVKDLFDVAGYPTGGGSPLVLAMSGIKSTTAPIVQRLLDAGARFVGKTHTDELAFSMNGKNAHFGTPVNGGAPDRIPGGSSSGSAAAVSNGLADFALGTDTGGSVRAPASHCGLFGIRPTQGRVDLAGCLDLAPAFDTCGFFTRDAATFARVADVMLGADSAPLPARVRLLEPTDAFALIDAAVRDALAPAITRVVDRLGAPTQVEVAPLPFEKIYWGYRYLQGHGAWQTDGPLIERFRLPLGPGVAERFAFGAAVRPEQVAEGLETQAAVTRRLLALLGDDGVMLLPTMPDVAPLLSTPESELENYRNHAIHLLCLAGLAGCPQVSMPLAKRLGAPLGLSIVGPRGSDRSLVALAQVIAD